MGLIVRIEPDAYRRASELATILNISPPQALGHLAFLWQWILSLRGDGQAPDGVVKGRSAVIRLEAGARWSGEPGKFLKALEELQLVVRNGDRKILVKGTRPYAAEILRKNRERDAERLRRKKARLAKLSSDQLISDQRRQALPVAQLESLKKFVDVNNNPGLDESGGTKHNHPLGFWTWMMRTRSEDVTSGDGILKRRGTAADRTPSNGFVEWYEQLKSEEVSDYDISTAWIRYLGDDHFTDRRHPVAVFITEGVFRPRLSQSS